MDTVEEFQMPAVAAPDLRIVLEHTRGRMAGVFSICGRQSHIPGGKLPEIEMAENLLDSPSMREPGPVSLVAVKRRFVLYRQITTPDMQNGKTFDRSQR